MANGLAVNYKYGFAKPEKYVFKSKKGLGRHIVGQISAMKGEPEWMREKRLKALEIFRAKKMPKWGADLSKIDFSDIFYYIKPIEKQGQNWKELPKEIRDTYDAIGIPEAERKFLAGVTAQYESEAVYHSFQKRWEEMGVVFCDMDTGLRKYPELVREYFGKAVPAGDNKFAALNSAVWSGGSFIYVPKDVSVDIPLQAYFRINAANMGQFERTLIIVDEGAYVHYVEGCLPAGEQINLGDRWVNIESVKPSDYVIDSNGQQSKVRAVMTRSYKGKIVKITPVSVYNSFRLTPEHPLLAIKRQDVLVKRKLRNNWLPETNTEKLSAVKPKYISAGELKRGDFLVFPKIKSSKKSHLSSNQLRLLGWYLAEGSTYIHKKLKMPVVSFSFGSFETDLINKVERLIYKVTGKRVYRIFDKDKRGCSLILYSKELRELCLEHCGKGARNKILSKEIMELEWADVESLIEGYFEGDGSVYRKNRIMIRASTASEQLSRQLQELLARGGYYASIQVRKGGKDTILGRNIKRGDQFVIYYAPKKRWSEVRETDNYFIVPIKRIEFQNYEGMVFNLDVEGSNSYLVRGFAVHNCTAPIYSTDSLHAAVVEIFVKKGARCRYTTIQNWSNNVYNLVTKRAFVEEDGTMEWVDGNIGCLTEKAMLFTNPGGMVSIRDIKPGDYIYSTDLNSLSAAKQRVVEVVNQGVKPVFKLTTSNYREIEATANHPFLVLRKTLNIGVQYVQWEELKNLKVGDWIAIANELPDEGFPNPINFTYDFKLLKHKPKIPTQTSEDLMWILGLYFGDGYMDSSKLGVARRIYFAVPPKNRARKKIERLIRKVFDVNFALKGICLTINSTALAKLFLNLGFSGTAKTKRIPKWVFGLPRSQKLAFIEGYFDADGYLRKAVKKDGREYGQIVFASANKKLLEDLKFLMITVGLNPLKIATYIKERKLYKGRLKEYTTHYLSMNIRGNLERIREKRKFDPTIRFVKVRSIEPIGKARVYDIEVGQTANFLANGIVVHNSKITMKYPSCFLTGRGARGEILSLALVGAGQQQDAGGKLMFLAPETSGQIISKSVSKSGGRTSYRGLVKCIKGAKGVKCNVRCDALILDEKSRSDTYPTMKVDEDNVTIGHEASVSKINEEQLFYLMSRGLSEAEATSLIVNGFIEPIVKELPLEYAVELNRLIQLNMEGAVG